MRPLLPLTLLALGCGARVTTESGPLDLCACMATRQTEAAASPAEPGPCLTCWIGTIAGDASGNGACHFDQQRCLDDPGCFAITACIGPCDSPACVDACIAEASSELSHDLYLDWLRCFCVTCEDECGARPTTPTEACSAK